jgi:hypothetical protein
VVARLSASAPAVSLASACIIVYSAKAGGGVCSMACITFIIHSFFCPPTFPPIAEVVFFECKRLVRSDLRGLSSANKMGSVITFRISETSAEEGEEAPASLSGTSCTFVPTGEILMIFRFLGTESFGSAAIFCFLMAFWSSLTDRMVCLFRILTTLFFLLLRPHR